MKVGDRYRGDCSDAACAMAAEILGRPVANPCRDASIRARFAGGEDPTPVGWRKVLRGEAQAGDLVLLHSPQGQHFAVVTADGRLAHAPAGQTVQAVELRRVPDRWIVGIWRPA